MVFQDAQIHRYICMLVGGRLTFDGGVDATLLYVDRKTGSMETVMLMIIITTLSCFRIVKCNITSKSILLIVSLLLHVHCTKKLSEHSLYSDNDSVKYSAYRRVCGG